ncbi:ribosome hibernation-promoting factor, HPF/YfiA family [Sessilibacter sp. MAH2]
MTLSISGHHVEVTDSIRNYVETKFEKLGKHNPQITTINVVLRVEKQRQKAEASVHISGKDIFAESESDDLYIAIDEMAVKLDRQLLKHKEKATSHR